MSDEAKPKLKLAIYWGSACGGCCVSVLDVHEKLLDILSFAEFVFWPIALDTKYADVEAFPDREIDICLYNGAVRNSENDRLAKLLRRKSKFLIAYGACAQIGGIPGLANLTTREEILRRVYEECESTVNPEGIRPQRTIPTPEGELELPEFYQDVRTLADVVEVDYLIPGCPPQTERLVEVLTALVQGGDLPPLGSVVGASEKAMCETCPREKSEKKLVKRFYRPWEVEDDGKTCLLEQGILCMGPATRGGCGERCIGVNSPCRGCYGPTPEAPDPGAGMLSAIATMIDTDDPEEIKKITEQIPDPVGTFYRFSLPSAILRRAVSS
jgi:F420-non-reducing hydrogenase small subunit